MESWSDAQILVVPEEISGRADKVLSSLISGMSRTRVQQSFEAGKVQRNGKILTKREKVYPGETLRFHLLESVESLLEPVDIPLDFLFEDDHVIFIISDQDRINFHVPDEYKKSQFVYLW